MQSVADWLAVYADVCMVCVSLHMTIEGNKDILYTVSTHACAHIDKPASSVTCLLVTFLFMCVRLNESTAWISKVLRVLRDARLKNEKQMQLLLFHECFSNIQGID